MEAQRLVLPISLAITISLSALYLGKQIGHAEDRLVHLEERVAEIGHSLDSVGATALTVAQLRTDFESMKKEQAQNEATAKQLWYYTHGRIQRMPWHPPQQEE